MKFVTFSYAYILEETAYILWTDRGHGAFSANKNQNQNESESNKLKEKY